MKDAFFPGDVLRERREALGFSIQEVHGKIHVPLACLEGFESGCFDRMPGRAYAVGFLRSYCRFLELDAESIIDEYLVCTRPQPSSGPFAFMKRNETDAPETVRPYPRWLNEVIAWGTVCAFLLFCWFSYTTVVQPLADSWKSRVEAGAIEAPPPIHFQEDF